MPIMPKLRANPEVLPWRQWYSLQRWRKRAKHQLQIEPLCRACLEQGRVTPATIADHDPPHRGNWQQFRLGPIQSLCAECHAHKNGADHVRPHAPRISEIGPDGFPVDAAHPFNRLRK
jgi:hypothetical protein